MVESHIKEILERRATRLGIPADQLLEHDRKTLREFLSSTESCIDPNFLERLGDGLFPMFLEMLAHVANCPMCATLVDVISQSKKKS